LFPEDQRGLFATAGANGEAMRSCIFMVCLSALCAGTPAHKAEALAGQYWQYHRTTGSTQCPNGYRWDKNVSKCRRNS
jgi:hypothetical protein